MIIGVSLEKLSATLQRSREEEDDFECVNSAKIIVNKEFLYIS